MFSHELSLPSPQPGVQRPERLLPDQFWMHSYKVAMFPLKHSHDWEKCIYAHEGEKARRRPVHKYQAIQCPEARAKIVCPRGEECPCTHHLFEYWLHPDRYMTCLCELGASCNRPICFFAHHQAELRALPEGLTHAANASGSSRRRAAAAAAASAAAAAAAQQARAAAAASANNSPAGQVGPHGSATSLGSRQLSTGSLASSGGSHGLGEVAGAAAGAGSFTSMGSGGSATALLQPQQQQALAAGAAAQIRPGFSALDALHSSSPPPADVLNAELMLQQTPGRAAAAGSNACPSVLVLEAPALLSPSHDLELRQAAERFSQLNLTAAGAGWISPGGGSTNMGQSHSNMSLASSTSSTMGFPSLGADAVAAAAAQAGLPTAVTTAMLLEAVQQQQQAAMSGGGAAGRVSPGNSGTTLLAVPGVNMRVAQAQAQGGVNRADLSALLGSLAGQAQLAALKASLEEPPEHLSFSLWDLHTSAAGAPGAPPQQLVSLTHSPLAASTPVELNMPMTSLEAFGGFAAGSYGMAGRRVGSTPPAGTQVIDLASAAANRLLSQQAAAGSSSSAATASIGLMGSAGPACMMPAADASRSNEGMAADARLTLLHAWVNAAVSSSNGQSRSFDGSVQQQEEELLQAAVGSSPVSSQYLGRRGMAVVAQDLARVLSPADLMLLVQSLQQSLQQN